MIKQCIWALIFFLVISVFFTYPLVLNFSSKYYGIAGESGGFIWYQWWLKFSREEGFNQNYCSYLNAPFGYQFGREPIPLFSKLISQGLSFFWSLWPPVIF
jgi:hypothetical protein